MQLIINDLTCTKSKVIIEISFPSVNSVHMVLKGEEEG